MRTGVNTGEAVVAYGIGPQIGEAVTGDVVNTAARLQGVAPVGGIVVGEPTYRATNRVLRYQPLPPVTVKGKAEPLPIWRAVAARGRVGDALARDQGTPFVGRHPERRALVGAYRPRVEPLWSTFVGAYRRAVREATAQLVVVAGEPGVGKSRLVAELGRQLDRSTDLVTWRQGRCLPYGEGVSFWALGEIVKAHAGILESDTAEDAAAKLDLVVPEDEPDRQWLRQRLAPLVGAGAPPAAVTIVVNNTPRKIRQSRSVSSGPLGLRSRVTFRPTRPQHDAGMRIEPPPSLACATGTMPAATAAAEPPLEPPAL